MLISHFSTLLLPEMRMESPGRVLRSAFLDLENGDNGHFLSQETNDI